MPTLNALLEAHYTPADLDASLLAALAAAGKDADRLTLEDLSAVDEFHVRGRRATVELAARLDLSAHTRVLDVGCGLGGAARYLAHSYGCQVTGIDLAHVYCRTAAMLTERLGLAHRVHFCRADGQSLPVRDASFDLVWTQHVTMNIADKALFCRDLCRALKPGGHLVCYEVVAGQGGAVHYPVPWARHDGLSFLADAGSLRCCMESAGLTIVHWQDVTCQGRDWFRSMAARLGASGPPPLSLRLLLGGDFPLMARNQLRNLEEERIRLVEVIACAGDWQTRQQRKG